MSKNSVYGRYEIADTFLINILYCLSVRTAGLNPCWVIILSVPLRNPKLNACCPSVCTHKASL